MSEFYRGWCWKDWRRWWRQCWWWYYNAWQARKGWKITIRWRECKRNTTWWGQKEGFLILKIIIYVMFLVIVIIIVGVVVVVVVFGSLFPLSPLLIIVFVIIIVVIITVRWVRWEWRRKCSEFLSIEIEASRTAALSLFLNILTMNADGWLCARFSTSKSRLWNVKKGCIYIRWFDTSWVEATWSLLTTWNG